MDNFTFVPGEIDDDQRTCLSLLLRFVKAVWLLRAIRPVITVIFLINGGSGNRWSA